MRVLEPREVPDPGDSDFDTTRRTGQKEGFDVNEPPYAIEFMAVYLCAHLPPTCLMLAVKWNWMFTIFGG